MGKTYIKLQIWTTEVYFKIEAIDWNESPLRYRTWTAKKDERYKQVQCRRGTHAIIVAFDVTDYKSFKNLTEWLKEIDRYSNDTTHTLAATKCDIPEKDWAVSKEAIRSFAEAHSLNVFFTSAKNNLNVEQLSEYITKFIIQEKNQSEESIPIAACPSKRL